MADARRSGRGGGGVAMMLGGEQCSHALILTKAPIADLSTVRVVVVVHEICSSDNLLRYIKLVIFLSGDSHLMRMCLNHMQNYTETASVCTWREGPGIVRKGG